MWEEGIICLFIFIGGFCILPSNIQKQLVSKNYMFITIIAGICLYIFSVYILKMYRRKTEQFDLISTCGTTGGRCSEDTPYCLVTEREVPTNGIDQTIVFNTYGRYVKVFPPATQGDGYVFLSSLEIFDSTGTNVLKGKAVSSPSRSDTTTPSQQAKLVGDNGGKIRRYPNIFLAPTNDRNTVAWEVDLGQVYMITKIRYIGLVDEVNILRNIGVRIRIYKNQTDVPTTGTCVAKPAITYPTGTTEDEKLILEPIILDGMNGDVALKVYRGIKSNPGTLLTSYGLTDEQATSAYVKMASDNNRMKTMGWNVIGTWKNDSNEISIISGSMPIVGQSIFSTGPVSVYKTFKAGETTPTYSTTDTKGTPELIFPIRKGSKVTQVNNRKITIDNKTISAGNNINIKMNGYQTDTWFAQQNLLLQNIKKLYQLPTTFNKEETIRMYKINNISTTSTFAKDATGNIDTTKTPVTIEDDGSIKTVRLIMSSTMPLTVDPNAGNSMNTYSPTADDRAQGYNITGPQDTTNKMIDALSNTTTPQSVMPNTNALKPQVTIKSINDQLDLTGQNTYDSSQMDLADAYALALSDLEGTPSNLPRDVGGGRVQVEELMLLGDSLSFTGRVEAMAACQQIGGRMATYDEVENEVKTLTPYLKLPQWHEFAWVQDYPDPILVTQKRVLDLPLDMGRYAVNRADYTNAVNTGVNVDISVPGNIIAASVTGRILWRSAAICKAKKPSIQPTAKVVPDNNLIQNITIKKKGRYVRIWTARVPYSPVNEDRTCNDSEYSIPSWLLSETSKQPFITKITDAENEVTAKKADQASATNEYNTAKNEYDTNVAIVHQGGIRGHEALMDVLRGGARVGSAKNALTAANKAVTAAETKLTNAKNSFPKINCVKNYETDRIALGQVVILNTEGQNLINGVRIKSVSSGSSDGTYSGDINDILRGNETVKGTGWISKKYLACPRNTHPNSIRKYGDGTTYQNINVCQADVYLEIDLLSSQFIETVKLIGISGTTMKGLRVEVADFVRPQPYNNDPKRWLWNDTSAFDPICPTGTQYKICVDPDTNIPSLNCLPSSKMKCPSECDPGSTWCGQKCKCVVNLLDPKTWQVMEINAIDADDFLESDGGIGPKYDAEVTNARSRGNTRFGEYFFNGEISWMTGRGRPEQEKCCDPNSSSCSGSSSCKSPYFGGEID